MSTSYEVPPGGGFFLGVPGIWQGGEVLEVDEESGAVTVVSGPASPDAGIDVEPAVSEDTAAARPATSRARTAGAADGAQKGA